MVPENTGEKVPILRLLSEVLVVAVAFIFFALVISVLFFFVMEGGADISAFQDDPEVREAMDVATLFAAPLVIFATLVVGDVLLRKRHVSLRSLGFKRPESIGVTIFEGLGLTAILLALWVAIWQYYETMNLGVPYKFMFVLQGNDFIFFYAMTAVAWVAAAFGEEVLFRGLLLNNFKEMFRGSKAGIAFAVIFQAMIYSFLHVGETMVQSVPVFLTGIILGVAYFLFNRNLWPLIIAHGILNNIYFTLVYTNTIG
ncbi:MAG: CPBP family intramembrane glutamic endopeptidase [Sphingomonadales bacterium]